MISSRAKCDYKMGFIVVRTEEDEKRIHIDDISVLVFESTAISITAYLLAELTMRRVKVIFCDNKRNPLSELVPCHGAYNSSGKIRTQISWGSDTKARIWREIVKEKIFHQAAVLKKARLDVQANILMSYRDEVELGDATNREGSAARVYFDTILGSDFYRNADDTRNAVLNYGYTILLSAFNREIAANGYLTQIGIWHDNAGNPFNLGSDLMEPFRPLVDDFARTCNFTEFEKAEKTAVLDILNQRVYIDEAHHYVNNAISIYTHSVFTALEENDEKKILFYRNEL